MSLPMPSSVVLVATFCVFMTIAGACHGQNASTSPSTLNATLQRLNGNLQDLQESTEQKETMIDIKASDLQDLRRSMNQAQLGLDHLKAIYGPDDRVDYKIADASQRAASETSVILVRKQRVTNNANDTYDLQTFSPGLCTPAQARELHDLPEPFYDEPAVGYCSGFKVGDNLIASAGHCIRTKEDCDGTLFLFDYRVDQKGAAQTTQIPASRVFQCTAIVARAFGGPDHDDWEIVKTDRSMNNYPNVSLDRKDDLTKATDLTVIGYPLGLPVKIANNASVRTLQAKYFVANLDTYGGNSGSAVFDSESLHEGVLKVEGILVRGEDDFKRPQPGQVCRLSKRCTNDGCKGEDVTYSKNFANQIP
jgi:V8-like Glu-specific endopeptidase